MKVLVVSESPADEAALRIITKALLGESAEFVTNPLQVRSGGVDAALRDLGIIYRAVFFRQEADVLVFVVDSDSTPVHRSDHVANQPDVQLCRFCRARSVIDETRASLSNNSGQVPEITTAIGLAVPAIEAWLLCGIDRHVGEVQWEQAMQESMPLFTVRELKDQLYGTSNPNLDIETTKMKDAALRVVQHIPELEKWFPGGFAPLAQVLRDCAVSKL